MVNVSSMLIGLSAALGLVSATQQVNSLSALPTFDVPAFDYPSIAQGENPARLLQALQTDGIIALKNIPNYANLRERYLRTAVQCAGVTANVDHDMFVSRKLFDDGTKRYTISTNAGRELSGSAMEVDTTCPGYRQLYEEFSQTLEHAVNTFGSTLDQTSFTASDGQRSISSRQLVSDAVRLDHFHAYEAVPSASNDQTHRQLEELSLPLHEDHGLFIAMSAPKFFDVGADRRLVERELSESASGLVIQTASGSRVRPVLKNDEVVIMMGTGASRWLETSHSIPAVMHGMKMPEGGENGVRSLRAWFGKMTLLPAYQRMLLSTGNGNGVSFEAHSNATTRFLLANQEDDLKTVGCATGRRLMASEGKCTLRECKTKAGKSDPAEGCPVICNRKNHSPDDEPNCTASCECSDSSSPAERCWMLCVANLPESECATAEQTCTGQKKTCKSSTSTSTTTDMGSMTGMTGMGSMHMDGSAHKDGSMAMTSGSSAKTDGSSVSADKTPVPAPSSAVRVLVSSAAVIGSLVLATFC